MTPSDNPTVADDQQEIPGLEALWQLRQDIACDLSGEYTPERIVARLDGMIAQIKYQLGSSSETTRDAHVKDAPRPT